MFALLIISGAYFILLLPCMQIPNPGSGANCFVNITNAVSSFTFHVVFQPSPYSGANILSFTSYFNQVHRAVQHFTFHVVFQPSPYNGATFYLSRRISTKYIQRCKCSSPPPIPPLNPCIIQSPKPKARH